MRTPIRAAVVLLTLATIGIGSTTAGADNEDNITICHRTNSNGNPYVIITTDASGQNGGTDHLNEHKGPLWNPDLKKQKIEWGDVIQPPPGQTEGSQAYEELLDAGGTFADFLENDCSMPETPPVPTHDVTLDKVTDGGSAPSADTEFTFTVVCESGAATSPVNIAAEDEPVLVADDVAEDDTCTITETGTNEAETTTFQVTGGTADATTATSVTVSVGADTAVVATNTYPDVLGEVITPKPKPKPAPEVLPDQLPRTGPMTPYYVAVAAALMVVGALARTVSRQITAHR